LHLAVRLLISLKADINTKDKHNRYTALHTAVLELSTDVIQLLLDSKADIEAKERLGLTPLYWAVNIREQDIIQILLKNNANLEAKATDGSTPLHGAVYAGDSEIVQLLIESKACLEAKDGGGYTPLHWATGRNSLKSLPRLENYEHESTKIIQILLDNNANLYAMTTNRSYPLH